MNREPGNLELGSFQFCAVIAAHASEQLFQPSKRLSRRDGLGLGLTIVDAAVANAHGARIDARARAGGGRKIHVSFPAYEGRTLGGAN